ncbi:MAG: bifunctional phosphoribosylaminoimidazolecarboxamide formyltransferase/IMP cyclohydrolase [Phycisphaerae bacterium]|nr:bifunctional phosphoribosylaminoimidazolecarboxamide formyltransferase/IMP cyclohydrolase [Phycisphaerae bacterium]
MGSVRPKTALISVFDKTGIAEFARSLSEEFGIRIISSGGTAKVLAEAGIEVQDVKDLTGTPAMLGHRVVTLHPKVHGGILAIRDDAEHQADMGTYGITPIDVVVTGLYPFEQAIAKPDCTFEQAIEMIDIGGPALVRAAAKNHKYVAILTQREHQQLVLEELRREGGISDATRLSLARQAFELTCGYDTAVSSYFQKQEGLKWPDVMTIGCRKVHECKYGENPHQPGAVYSLPRHQSEPSLVRATLPGGNPMSFNNYVDAESAFQYMRDLHRLGGGKPCVSWIKHTNPCGAAIADTAAEAYRLAYLGDPIAAAGGIIAMNFPITAEIARMAMNTYQSWGKAAGAAFFKLDVWVAPSFDDAALKIITTPTEKRKWGASCRLVAVGDVSGPADETELDVKKIAGGMLIQARDLIGLNEPDWKVVTKRKPTEAEMVGLRFAWLTAKHTKSNTIIVARGQKLLGTGAGQMSRVMSAKIAVELATEHGHLVEDKQFVAASDAMFPVPDGPTWLMEAGATAIIQPGGSNRDADVIAAADERNVAMVLTGMRHFKH